MKKKNKYVIAPIMFYDSKGTKPEKLYRVLSCFLSHLIDNYVCIDYLYCQYKTLGRIYSNIIYEQTSFNMLLGIDIPEVLLNLVSCHGFIERKNSTVILNFRSCLVNNHLEKWFFLIENNSKQLIILSNDVELIIHANDQLETYFVMKKTQKFPR